MKIKILHRSLLGLLQNSSSMAVSKTPDIKNLPLARLRAFLFKQVYQKEGTFYKLLWKESI